MSMEVRGHKRALLLLVPLLVAGMILACDLGGLLGRGGAVPNVVINAPPSNIEVRLGEEIPIRSTATDATGVTKIELWVNEALYTSEISAVAQGQSPFSVVQNWTPQALGSHKIVVRAYNAAGNMGESASITLVVVSEPPGPPATPTEGAGPPPTVTPTQPGPVSPTATQPPPPATGTPPPTHTPPPPTHTPPPGPCLPSVVTTIGLVGHPKGVATHGNRVYVGLHDVPSVAVINADTNGVLTYWDTGVSGQTRYANGLVFHPGAGRLYVANRNNNSVSSIDPAAPASANLITVGSQPFGLAAAGQYVYVANFADNRVGRIDTSSDTYFSLIDVFYQPALLGSLGQDVFVPTNGPGRIIRIPPSGSPIAVGPDKEGYFAAAVNANQRVFVTNRKTDEVIKINANNNSVQDTVSMPHTPYGIAVNLSKNRVYVVAAGANLLYVLDGATLQTRGTVPIGAQDATEGGQGIAVLGNKIYVSNYQGSSLTVLDDSACP